MLKGAGGKKGRGFEKEWKNVFSVLNRPTAVVAPQQTLIKGVVGMIRERGHLTSRFYGFGPS